MSESVHWQDWALCKWADPDLFDHRRCPNDDTKMAQAICKACPVIENCLSDALKDKRLGGVRGGFTEYERNKLRRKRSVSAHVPSLPLEVAFPTKAETDLVIEAFRNALASKSPAVAGAPEHDIPDPRSSIGETIASMIIVRATQP